MKKIASIITIIILLSFSIFTLTVYADTLDAINVSIDKDKIHPGESIILNVAFGEDLGAYTVEVEYDSDLVKFDSAEGGSSNDTGDKVIITFYDTEGGSSPRNNMHVTFTANTEGITTSNPTQFKVTMRGMTSPDTHTNYDDITQPYTKSFIVEPQYEDYNIALDYDGKILPEQEKEMTITITSAMGKNYEHTRINANVTGPTESVVKLLGIDDDSIEHDIIQSGWGSDEGDPVGGEEVEKILNVRGLFSKIGTYALTLSLVDRDNADQVIATETFPILVTETTTQTPDNNEPENSNKGETEKDDSTKGETDKNNSQDKEQPEKMPDTGNMIYVSTICSILALVSMYAILKKKYL